MGSDLCYWIVTDSGQVVSKTTPKEEEYDDMIVEEWNLGWVPEWMMKDEDG